MRDLNYDQWLDEYGPFEIYDTHDERLRDMSYLHAWTYRTNDGDGDVITNGFGIVNRLEYYITAKPWKEDETIFVTW